MSKQKLCDTTTRVLLFWHIMMWILYMPITQLQLALFGRRVVTLLHFGVVEVVIILLQIAWNSFTIKYGKYGKITFAFLAAFFGIWIISIMTNSSVAAYWRMYYLIYWIVPLLVLIICSQRTIDAVKLTKLMLLIAVIHAGLIFYQHFSNNILWPYSVDEEGNKLFFISSGYYNLGKYMDRCPGLCISGLEAGLFLVFGILLVAIYPKMSKRKKAILTVLFLIAIWFTGTRNIYVQIAFVFGMSVLLKTKKISVKNKYVIGIIMTFLATGLYLYLFSSMGTGVSTKNIMTDTLSIIFRTKGWTGVINRIKEGGILSIVFGQGVWQSAGFSLLIDNMYLELIVLSGVVGCVLYIVYWLRVTRVLIFDGSTTGYLFASFVLSMFVYGMGNVAGNAFITLSIVILILFNNKENLA